MDTRRSSTELLLRSGLVVAALAAVAAAAAGFLALAEGPARRAPVAETARLEVGALVSPVALVAVLVIGASLFFDRDWLRAAAALATTTVSFVAGVQVLGARVDDVFAPDIRTTLLGGGLLLVVAFWLGVIAIGLQLLAHRREAISRAPLPEEELVELPVTEAGRPLRSAPTARLGVLLGVAGAIAPMASGGALAVSIGALGDVRAAEGRLGGRGMALAGVVLGSIGLSLLVAVLGVAPLVLTPAA